MPSLLLKNLPESTTVDVLTSSFSPYNPRSISISGKTTLEVSSIVKEVLCADVYILYHFQATVGSFESAFKLAGAISKLDINGQTLQVIRFAAFAEIS